MSEEPKPSSKYLMVESSPSIDEDEIDLLELIRTLLAAWKTIAIITILCTGLAFAYALSIPESFKVLVKEMQSLCLNVEVLSSEGVAIEMRDTDEEVFRAAEELGINLSRVEPSSVEEV